MVLDALGAFALACNILQVIDFGIEVTVKAIEYGNSNTGTIAEYHALGEVADDLTSMSKDLEQSTTSSSEILLKANQECLSVTKDFKAILDQFKLKRGGIAKRFLLATRATWRRKDIQAMQNAVANARSNLHFAFALHSHSMNQTSNSESEKNILAAVSRMLSQSQSGTETLLEAMKNLEIEEVRLKHATTLSQLSDDLNQLSIVQNKARNHLYEADTLAARNAILKSLYFDGMYDRPNHMRTAHKTTFEWVFMNATVEKWLMLDNILWIAGKPGSGKSTLMRFIAEYLDNKQADDIVSFYIWKLGEKLQRSLEGIYRALLFQLLEQDSQLADIVRPTRHALKTQLITSWSLQELQEGLLLALSRSSQSKIVLLDGLDELDGDDEDRYSLLKTIRMIANLDEVKVCVSSRPWNIFQDCFATDEQFLLEKHTKNDMEIYVNDNLLADPNFRRSCGNRPADMQEFAADVVTKARGVFLWVYLVVRELAKGARDGEQLRTLRERFRRIPTDLDEYFRQIMETIEPEYRCEASMMLQIQLAYITTSKMHEETGIKPTIFEMSFVDQSLSHSFTLDLDFDNFEERALLIDLTKRRIASRCMGLVDINDHSLSGLSEALGGTVEIFHRTFADFLLLPNGQSLLHEFMGIPFDVAQFRVKSYLAFVNSINRLQPSHILELLDCIAIQIGDVNRVIFNYNGASDDTRREAVARNLSAAFAQSLDQLAWQTSRWNEKDSIYRLLNLWRTSEGSFMREIAISYGWIIWINENMTSLIIRCKPGRPFLFYAFFPYDLLGLGKRNWERNWELVVPALLRLGADPNQIYTGRTLWVYLLIELADRLSSELSSLSEDMYIVVGCMIANQASLEIALEEFQDRGSLKGWFAIENVLSKSELISEGSRPERPKISVIKLLTEIGWPESEISKLKLVNLTKKRQLPESERHNGISSKRFRQNHT